MPLQYDVLPDRPNNLTTPLRLLPARAIAGWGPHPLEAIRNPSGF